MIDVEVAEHSQGSLVHGFAACLASVTETDLGDLPTAGPELRHALGAWRTWLAARGSGLIPVADPGRFQWPGWWIAVVDPAAPPQGTVTPVSAPPVAVLAFGTPPGVVLSPQLPGLLGRALSDLHVLEAQVVTSLDPVLRDETGHDDLHGTVQAVAVAAAAEAPMQLVEVARLRSATGILGDRYADRAGTFGPRTGTRPGYDLTLIAAEALAGRTTTGTGVGFLQTRRNVLTRGVDVNQLVGRTFLIGDVLCAGRRLCEPCAHLERVSGPGLLRPLIHRSGLRVDVLSDGDIRAGSAIRST